MAKNTRSRRSQQSLARAAAQSPEGVNRNVSDTAQSPAHVSYGRSASLWIGPLPAPETFAEYERVLPGASEIIIRNWEDESAHRRQRQLVSADRKYTLASRGQVLSFLLGTGGLSVIGYSVHLDRALQPELMWTVAVLIAAMAGRAILPLFRRSGEDANGELPAETREGR